MTSQNIDVIFVKGVIERFITDDIADYVEMLSSKDMDDYTKKVILDYMKLAIFNCVSGFFGVLDGVSFVDGTDRGKKLILAIDNIEIQGNLHDIFNQEIQNFENELSNSSIYK